MKNEIIELNKLQADDDKWLTNGETYAQTVYLGAGDSPEYWREITQEEYSVIMAEQEEAT